MRKAAKEIMLPQLLRRINSSFIIHGFKTCDNKVAICGNITFTDKINGIIAVKNGSPIMYKNIIREMEAFTKTL